MSSLITWYSGQELDENGVSHLAMAMMHVGRLMGGTVAPNRDMALALTQGAMFNATSAPPATPPPQAQQPVDTPPPEAPKKPPKMTADGFVILEFQPGITLTTDQARERSGVGKSQMARLLQDNKFVRPAGVIESASTGRFNKVYLAEEIDAWKAKRNKPKREISEEAKAKLRANIHIARAANAELETVEWAHVANGQWWTYETVSDYVKLSRGWLNKAIKEGKFPGPKAKARAPGTAGTGSSLFWPQDVIDWVNQSTDAAYARAARREADRNPERPRTADDSASEEPHQLAPSPAPAPAPIALDDDQVNALENLGRVTQAGPSGWMNLRQVAEFLDVTETEVERMVKAGRFPKAHKQNGKLHIREWGARQVAKWKRENLEHGVLAK